MTATAQVMDGAARPEVELSEQDGNAFFIIGRCVKAGRRSGWSKEQQDAFTAECMSGDYDHVLQTAMTYCEVS